MSINIIQAEYDKLENIAGRFGESAESTADMQSRIKQSVHALQNGRWEGKGSTAFFTEMERGIFPAMIRLTDALEQAQSVTLQVKDIFQAAEEGAARPFGGEADGVPIDASNLTINGNDLFPKSKSTDEIFGESYMDGMVGKQIHGAGDPRLIEGMSILNGNPTPAEVDEALDKIAAARGMTREEVQANYNRYLELRAEAKRIGDAKEKGGWTPLNEAWHPDFMGSTVQLRYGQVVGDALGIDPVFGSMLNPTGGLVMGGNYSFQTPAEHPLSYHGIFHDASGYLRNYHEVGPGYDYLGGEGRDVTSSLTGHQGIPYWNEKLGIGGLEATVTNGVATGLGKLQDTYTWIEDTATDIGEGAENIMDTAQDAIEDIQEGIGGVFEWAF